MGHVRDLPGDAKEIPAKYKALEWSRLGVNVDNDFEPLYIVPSDKKAVVRELKDALADVRPADPRDRRRPRGGEHLLAPARVAAAEGAGEAHGVPRDHPRGDPGRARSTRATWTTGWCGRRKRGASSTAWWATPSRPCCGRRSRGASRPAGCSRWRCGCWWCASASAAPSAPAPTGISWRSCGTPGRAFKAELSLVGGKKVATGRDFDESTGKLMPGRDVVLLGENGGRCAPHPPPQVEVDRHRHRGKAEHPPALGAVHHLHAAAGSQPQAPALGPRHHAHGAEPLRARLHHLYAYRLGASVRPGHLGGAERGAWALRQGVPAGRAPALLEQECQRPGSARGHPPGRRLLQAAERSRPRRPRAGALRPDLEAHGGQPDGRRPPDRHRGHRSRRPTRSSAPPASASISPASSAPMSRDRTIPRRRSRTRRSSCRRSRRATRPPARSSRRFPTKPSRRRATPKRRWSRHSRPTASAAPAPMPASSARSSSAAMRSGRDRHWCRRSRRSR